MFSGYRKGEKPVIARPEGPKQSRFWDCFAPLAMTLALLLAGAYLPQATLANNADVLNVSVPADGIIRSQGTAKVQFDVSWANSWRIVGKNRDAIWVFIKYSTDSGATWKHATLKRSGTNPADFTAGTVTPSNIGLQIVVPSDRKGAFIERGAEGAMIDNGNVSAVGVKFVWDYAHDGVTPANSVRVKVFAIEMVYIPMDSFRVGSGGASETGTFYKHPNTSGALAPYSIATEEAISVGAVDIYLNYAVFDAISGKYTGDGLGPIPAAFPKGHKAFYLMKYEISQGQYADFLNTTSSAIAANRKGGAGFRYTITGTHPNYSAENPDRACNFLSWADLAAYADWAGLRPMTELEFEKACRGLITPVADEYAWGNTILVEAITLSVASSAMESGIEYITDAGANCNYGTTALAYSAGGGSAGVGPLRCGIFATAGSNRQASGAGYYGNMELSGNVWERAVTVGNPTGRAFTGAHGDGALSAAGDANVDYWPGTDAIGSGFRGDGMNSAALGLLKVSDRYYAAKADTGRAVDSGGRCARTE